MKTNHESQLDISCGYESDVVTIHGSTHIATRICVPLKYIFSVFLWIIIGNWLLLVRYLHIQFYYIC
jgi:hypothetical protein